VPTEVVRRSTDGDNGDAFVRKTNAVRFDLEIIAVWHLTSSTEHRNIHIFKSSGTFYKSAISSTNLIFDTIIRLLAGK
jgi:hypothetical protein